MEDRKDFFTLDDRKREIIFLEELKKEIETLEYQKNHYRSINFEKHLLRTFKAFLHLIKVFPIYGLTATLSYPLFRDSLANMKKDSGTIFNSITFVWLFIALTIGIAIHSSVDKKINNMEFMSNYISKINDKYKLVNPKELEKIIKIKCDNYERLTR